MPLIDIKSLKGCCIIRPHGSAEIALTQKFSERLNHFEIPTVEAEPVRHGRWECTDDDGGVYQCTACGEEWYLEAGTPEENNMHYCPHCGACMDAGDDQGGGAENG